MSDQEYQQPLFEDSDHMPLVAIWYQMRTALADFLMPMLAGLTTVWFIVFSPRKFFNIAFHPTTTQGKLRWPTFFLWNLLTNEEKKPLEAAQFLLFGIFTAALGGFQFDNSNRLSGFLNESGITKQVVDQLIANGGAIANVVTAVQQALNSTAMQTLQGFLDQTIVAALMELIITLFLTMVFALIFYLFVGRKISATNSYIFWLYMIGLQFFTTGISSILFSVTSLSAFGLPDIAPNFFFWLQEFVLRVLWLFVFPAVVLPRIYPQEISSMRILGASVVGRGILAGAGWLLLGGFYTVLTFIGSLSG